MLHRVALSAAAQQSRVVGGLKCCHVNVLSSHQGDKKTRWAPASIQLKAVSSQGPSKILKETRPAQQCLPRGIIHPAANGVCKPLLGTAGAELFSTKLGRVTQTNSKQSSKTLIYAAIADLVLVVLLALSGRSSHSESLTAAGVLQTAWPFLAALAIGWLVCRMWRAPLAIWPQGVCLWLITVAGGMALRILSGNTAELPFVIVATLVLALFLLGHRLLATFVTRRAKRA